MDTMQNAPSTVALSQNHEALPPGLYWRGKVLWISKVINGKRHQFSTGCKTSAEGIQVLNHFTAKHSASTKVKNPQPKNSDRGELPKGLYWKGNVIWLSRMVNGKHYNISCGTSDLKLAKQFLADFNLKAFKNEKLGVKTRAKLTFGEMVQRYLDQGQINGLRPKTVVRYNVVRKNFQEFLDSRGLGTTTIENFSTALIEDYKVWRFAQKIKKNGSPAGPDSTAHPSQRTIQTEVQTVAACFKEALRQDFVIENPMVKVRPIRIVKRAPIHLDESEIKAFLNAAATYDEWTQVRRPLGVFLHDMFVTYLKTGMRSEELRHLEWLDIKLDSREIFIREEKLVPISCSVELPEQTATKLLGIGIEKFKGLSTIEKRVLIDALIMPEQEFRDLEQANLDFRDLEKGVLRFNYTINWHPKSTGRTIPISDGLASVLSRQVRTSNLVFPDPTSLGLWRSKPIVFVQRCAQHAKISKSVHTHTLRHTFASHMRRNGVALETIKELLGHSDIRDTLIYAHFSPEESRAAIPKIDFF